MSLFVIIFMIIATIFALASLVYVTVDIILEILARKKEPEEEEPEPEPEVVPVIVPVVVPEPEPEPEVMPEIVEHIDAEEADEMISDDLAMKTVRYESPAGHGKQGIINIGALDHIFEAGDVITLEELKRRGLVSRSFGRIKILADGVLNKPLTIKAESYSIQAIKMIELTGGTVIILKD